MERSVVLLEPDAQASICSPTQIVDMVIGTIAGIRDECMSLSDKGLIRHPEYSAGIAGPAPHCGAVDVALCVHSDPGKWPPAVADATS